MLTVEDFLTNQEEEAIINAIQLAEKKTSGEIRIHIENASTTNYNQRAKEIFHYLKMDNTKLQNGVLIYVSLHNKIFVIYGDKGIDKVVSNDFWNTTRDTIQAHFIQGDFKQGLIEGVIETGKQLETFFPWKHFDTDELSNKISKG